MDFLKYADIIIKNRDFADFFNSVLDNKYIDYHIVYKYLYEKDYDEKDINYKFEDVIAFIKTASSRLEIKKEELNFENKFDASYFDSFFKNIYEEVKKSCKLGFLMHNLILTKSCFFREIFSEEDETKKIKYFGYIIEEDSTLYFESEKKEFNYSFYGKRCIFEDSVIGSFLKSKLEDLDPDCSFLVEWLVINIISALEIRRLLPKKEDIYLEFNSANSIYLEIDVPVIYTKSKVMKIKDSIFSFNLDILNYDLPFLFTFVSDKNKNSEIYYAFFENKNFFYIPTKDSLEVLDDDYILEGIDLGE